MLNEEVLKIMEALLANKGLQAIANATTEALDNPVWMIDVNSKFMTSLVGELKSSYLREENERGYAAEKTLDYVREKQVREHTLASERPYTFDTLDTGQRIMNCSVTINGVVVGFLNVVDERHPFRDGDEDILLEAARIISVELQKNDFYKNNKELKYSYLLFGLLEGHVQYMDARERMTQIGIEPKKYFYLLNVDLENVEARQTTLRTIEEQIKYMLPNCMSIMYFNHYIFLYSSDQELSASNVVYQRLNDFLAVCKLKAAVSENFRDATLVPRNYQKTADALRIGKVIYPERNLYHYYMLASYHALTIIRELFSSSDFCNRAIDKLLEYDEEYHKNLTTTLYRYLECCENVTKAAEQLNIHSNTLRQRLEKIVELTECNLANGHQVFDLMMALQLHDIEEEARDLSDSKTLQSMGNGGTESL